MSDLDSLSVTVAASDDREAEPEAVETVRSNPCGRVVVQTVVASPEVDPVRLGDWAEELVTALAPEADSLVVRLTSAGEIRRLNETYRDRPGATDVLSFRGESSPDGFHLGDVVIAVPVAVRQASRAGLSVEVEIERLVLHGLLHCLGYDHETDDGEMRRLERRLRARWIEEGPRARE